jgi:hypothetical protein
MKGSKNIIVNSSLLFVVATILEMTLHECGHFIAAILLHAKGIELHHNYVSANTSEMSRASSIFFAGTGPIVSLALGLLFHFICSRQKKRNMLFLFNLYMAVFGYVAFFGYLLIAPFFTYGDTGYIFMALGFPLWLTITISITSAFVVYLIMGELVRYFVEMGTSEVISDKEQRHVFINALVKYPLFIGIAITVLLNLPVPTFLSLLYPLCSPFCIMWVFDKALVKVYPANNMNSDLRAIQKIQPIWVVVFLLVIIMNRSLVHGIIIN